MYLIPLFRHDRLACVRHNRWSRQNLHSALDSKHPCYSSYSWACRGRSIDCENRATGCEMHRALMLRRQREAMRSSSRVCLTRLTPGPALRGTANQRQTTACSGWMLTALLLCAVATLYR